jgi:hypothetical protein
MNTCQQCQKDFEIPDRDQAFYDRKKMPEPKNCSRCRRQRRLAFWPFGVLQKRKCDFSGETIISTYSPEARFPVYKRKYWFSDDWEAPEMEIDWGRSFMDQLYELQSQTPHFHQFGKQNENCDYADDVWTCKNAYMSRSMLECEDVCYVYRVLYSKDCLELTYCYHMEQCYECTYCFRCFNLKFSLNSNDCNDANFLYDCRSCSDCFMCWNLRNKRFCILNEQLSEADYQEKIKEFDMSSRSGLQKLWVEFQENLRKDAIHRADHNVKIQDSDGNYLTESKNCHDCYFLEYAEDCAYVMRAPYQKDSMDINGLLRGELAYEVAQSTDINNVSFASFCVDLSDSFYVDQCFNSKSLFGCVGLKRREYCILNKQYSQKEYEDLLLKLIEKMKADGEWGEFFPYKFAYNGFNLSLGSFYYEETEESARAKGSFWEKELESAVDGVNGGELPDKGVDDELLGKAINCAETGRPYSFIKQELDFYKKHDLPMPDLYPEQRNKKRFAQLMPMDGRELSCGKCGVRVMTYYPEKWGYEKIYCEECYRGEIY